jgi:hypothetical protein
MAEDLPSQSQGGQDDGPEIELETPPPSVRIGVPLVDSYSWHSLESTESEEEYILGV